MLILSPIDVTCKVRSQRLPKNKNGALTKSMRHQNPLLEILHSHAAPIDRLAWKHSRQNTGRPCVGRNGTVVSFPHCEQVVFVSARTGAAELPAPPPSARLALQPLHRFGSFLNPLSAKNICSPAVNTNSAPHSEHFNTLSWNSMSAPPGTPFGQREGPNLHREPGTVGYTDTPGLPGTDPWGLCAKYYLTTQTSLPDRGLIPEVRRRASPRAGANPARGAASCAVASAKALL